MYLYKECFSILDLTLKKEFNFEVTKSIEHDTENTYVINTTPPI
jgi:hypothetical protein